MLCDAYERDIKDKIKWQYELSKQLSDQIPLPKPIDFYEDNGDAYFVMDFVHGDPVTVDIYQKFS